MLGEERGLQDHCLCGPELCICVTSPRYVISNTFTGNMDMDTTFQTRDMASL